MQTIILRQARYWRVSSLAELRILLSVQTVIPRLGQMLLVRR